jgi:hypothetical protein
MSDVEPIHVTQLGRNVRAFLEAKGESIELERTPEYLTNGANLLKKVYGIDLAAYLTRQDDTRRFRKWVKGVDLPKPFEAVGLLAAIEVTEILLGKFPPKRAKEWMMTPCSYIIDNLPMDILREDSELVRRAALQIFL